MRATEKEVRIMLSEVLKLLSHEREAGRVVLPIEGCCRMLLCMSSMSSDYDEVRALLSEIAVHLHSGQNMQSFKDPQGQRGGREEDGQLLLSPLSILQEMDFIVTDVFRTGSGVAGNASPRGGARGGDDRTGSGVGASPKTRRRNRKPSEVTLATHITGKNLANALYGLRACDVAKHAVVREVLLLLMERCVRDRPVLSGMDVNTITKVRAR